MWDMGDVPDKPKWQLEARPVGNASTVVGAASRQPRGGQMECRPDAGDATGVIRREAPPRR